MAPGRLQDELQRRAQSVSIVYACAEVNRALSRCCLGAEMFLHARAFIAGLSVQCLFRRACGRIEEKSYMSDVKEHITIM